MIYDLVAYRVNRTFGREDRATPWLFMCAYKALLAATRNGSSSLWLQIVMADDPGAELMAWWYSRSLT